MNIANRRLYFTQPAVERALFCPVLLFFADLRAFTSQDNLWRNEVFFYPSVTLRAPPPAKQGETLLRLRFLRFTHFVRFGRNDIQNKSRAQGEFSSPLTRDSICCKSRLTGSEWRHFYNRGPLKHRRQRGWPLNLTKNLTFGQS